MVGLTFNNNVLEIDVDGTDRYMCRMVGVKKAARNNNITETEKILEANASYFEQRQRGRSGTQIHMFHSNMIIT